MFGGYIVRFLPMGICIIAIAVTIYMYNLSTQVSESTCEKCEYKYIYDNKTDENNPVYYAAHLVGGKPQILKAVPAEGTPGTSEYVPASPDYLAIDIKTSIPTDSEQFIPNLKSVYKENFSKCGGINCNSRKNEWEELSGKKCTNPNCLEHFNSKSNGLYSDVNYIKPENFTTGKLEYYTDVGTNGIPRVDMKDKLREGAPILRGDISITPSDMPIVGGSKLRNELLTKALFY